MAVKMYLADAYASQAATVTRPALPASHRRCVLFAMIHLAGRLLTRFTADEELLGLVECACLGFTEGLPFIHAPLSA